MRKNIIDLLEAHKQDIQNNLENPEEALRCIENLILDLEQMHFAISVLIDPPEECEGCLIKDCPGHPSRIN